MVPISPLRLARLQKGWTLDDLFLRSGGKLYPARVSRIERGLSCASQEESRLFVMLLGVTEQTVSDSDISSHPGFTESLTPTAA
jgi:hypothetical protein